VEALLQKWSEAGEAAEAAEAEAEAEPDDAQAAAVSRRRGVTATTGEEELDDATTIDVDNPSRSDIDGLVLKHARAARHVPAPTVEVTEATVEAARAELDLIRQRRASIAARRRQLAIQVCEISSEISSWRTGGRAGRGEGRS